MWRRVAFLGAQSRKGAGSYRSPLGVSFYLWIHPLTHNYTKFDMITHMGRGLVFRGHQHFRPKGTGSQSSTIIVVPFYLCVGLPRLEVVSRRPLHVACAACAASPTLFYCPSAACETITSRQIFSTF